MGLVRILYCRRSFRNEEFEMFLHLDTRHRQILVPPIPAHATIPATVMSSIPRRYSHSNTISGIDQFLAILRHVVEVP